MRLAAHAVGAQAAHQNAAAGQGVEVGDENPASARDAELLGAVALTHERRVAVGASRGPPGHEQARPRASNAGRAGAPAAPGAS